jgi:hypothetical protein
MMLSEWKMCRVISRKVEAFIGLSDLSSRLWGMALSDGFLMFLPECIEMELLRNWFAFSFRFFWNLSKISPAGYGEPKSL